jgi:hypothetical protein
MAIVFARASTELPSKFVRGLSVCDMMELTALCCREKREEPLEDNTSSCSVSYLGHNRFEPPISIMRRSA